jgi:cyclase
MATTLLGEPARYDRGLREVGPGVHAWVQPNGSWGEANAGLVVGDGAAALIDTLWDQRLARELLAATAPLTADAPIELVVNTHADGDHWWGNAEVPAAASIVTSRASLEAMRAELAPANFVRLRTLAAVLAGLPERTPGGLGLTGRYLRSMLGPYAFEQVRQRFPDRTFTGSVSERVGGRELRLTEVGPAHTAGDAIVHVPDAGVVFGADVLFFGVTPVMWHGPLRNWLAALETLLALDADTFVPGHGPVGGRAEIEALRDYWTWLEAAATAHHRAGRSPWAAARAMTRDPEFARWRDWVAPERIAINVTCVHRHLSGRGPVPASPAARTPLFTQVAALARELAAAR